MWRSELRLIDTMPIIKADGTRTVVTMAQSAWLRTTARAAGNYWVDVKDKASEGLLSGTWEHAEPVGDCS